MRRLLANVLRAVAERIDPPRWVQVIDAAGNPGWARVP